MNRFFLITCFFFSTMVMADTSPPEKCVCHKAFEGFFLGGNVGYGYGSVKETITYLPALTLSEQLNAEVQGVDGGINVGYTHRFENFGVGPEFVANWATSQGTSLTTFVNNIVGNTTLRSQFRLNNSLQLRLNFSYIIANLVAPKIILGWDNSSWTRSDTLTLDAFTPADAYPISTSTKARYNGFLFGIGSDFLMTEYLTAGVEYTGTLYQTVTSSSPAVFYNAETYSPVSSSRPFYSKIALTLKLIY